MKHVIVSEEPKDACEHPGDRQVRGAAFTWCMDCGHLYVHPGYARRSAVGDIGKTQDALYLTPEPPSEKAPAPEPVCKHRGTDTELHGIGDHSIGLRTCSNRNCQAIWVGKRWYIPEPLSEKPDAAGSET